MRERERRWQSLSLDSLDQSHKQGESATRSQDGTRLDWQSAKQETENKREKSRNGAGAEEEGDRRAGSAQQLTVVMQTDRQTRMLLLLLLVPRLDATATAAVSIG